MRTDSHTIKKGESWSRTGAFQNLARYRQRLLVYVCAVTAIAFMSVTFTTIKSASAESLTNILTDRVSGKH